ncbi:sialidase family protein [Pedosphaera parvula]|uniref:exo-alpha-sialidase n=1 Tax=Pedosphaera parvula (strain Ellin514) TaxID=320771 RepID=B9XD10_PEDPL|nr:sialidase family protein [Pedosphaera parvula]EEF62356.1 Exo-alpha-sialidase [Pedosphaera parvula Ellin514]
MSYQKPFRPHLQIATLLAVLLLLPAIAGITQAAPGFIEKIDLFKAGEEGHALYRIPGIVVTTNGTLLAYCEARKNSNSDWAESETFLRRSTDGGKTWEPPRQIAHFGPRLPRSPVAIRRKAGNDTDQTVNNPVAIVDRQTGTVHFLYCVNYQKCFYLRSDDDGVTFSKPADISAAFESFRPAYDCNVIATGPGHGIQLSNGRLVVPVWISTGAKGHGPSVATTIYSDDHGRTWQHGEIAAPNTADWVEPNETIAMELADGGVMLNIRSASKPNRRLVTTSPDGATHWTKPHFDDALVEPVCMASLIRLSTMPANKTNRVLFSNPENLSSAKGNEQPGAHRDRRNLTIKLSYDEARSWPVHQTLEEGPSAYSDMAVLPDGTILCFYERQKLLTVARFNLEWLTGGKDSWSK